MQPAILDLYCCEGGAAEGYRRAGFRVALGVDVRRQPRYPFPFRQADALAVLDELLAAGPPYPYAAVHASPPCQLFTRARAIQNNSHPDLLAPTRERLEALGLPYIIENVRGAPLRNPVVLCADSLGLPFHRERLFECSFPVHSLAPACGIGQIDVLPEHVFHTRAAGSERGGRRVRGVSIFGHNVRAEIAQAAMEMPWATRDGVSEAIPPRMTAWLGDHLRLHLGLAPVPREEPFLTAAALLELLR